MRRRAPMWLVFALAIALLAVPAAATGDTTRSEEQVLGELFTLGRALEAKRTAIARVTAEIAVVQRRREEARAELTRLEAERTERQARLGRRLRYYHEHGRVAPMGVLLGAHSFLDFLSRVDLLSQILDQDARLIREVRSLTAQVAAREQTLRESEASLDQLQRSLQVDEATLAEAVAQREALLAGLREERAAMEARLAALERTFTASAMPVLEALGSNLLTIDPAGLEPDELTVSLFPPGAVALVSARSLTELFARREELKGLTVRVVPDTVSLEGSFEGTAVRIGGHLRVAGPALLRFEPEQIHIGDFAVPPQAIHSLTEGGRIDIELGDMVSPFVLKEVTLGQDQLRIRAGLR